MSVREKLQFEQNQINHSLEKHLCVHMNGAMTNESVLIGCDQWSECRVESDVDN